MQLTAGLQRECWDSPLTLYFRYKCLRKEETKDRSSINVSLFFFFFGIDLQANLAPAFMCFAFNGELMGDVTIIHSFYQLLLWEKVGSCLFSPF